MSKNKTGIFFIVLSICMALCFTACAKINIITGKDDGIENTVSDDHDDNKKDSVSKNKPKESDKKDKEKKTPEWVDAYQKFLSDHDNFDTLLKTENDGGAGGYISGFFLYDTNDDNVPELFVQKYWTHENIYTYDNGNIKLIGSIMLDIFAETYFAYRNNDSTVYMFTRDCGTYVSRSTSLGKLIMSYGECEETPGTPEWSAQEPLYSGEFGEIETGEIDEDGNDIFISIDWADSIRSDDISVISAQEFYDTVDELNPFIHKKITGENIQKYVTTDYKNTDMYTDMAFEELYDTLYNEYADIVWNTNELDPDTVESWQDEYGYDMYISKEDLRCYPASFVTFKETNNDGKPGKNRKLLAQYAEAYFNEHPDDFSIDDKVSDVSEFCDLDNDGEDELVLYTLFGEMHFDARNGNAYNFAESDGTAYTLCHIEFNGEMWIYHCDVTHAGRQMFWFEKYHGAQNLVDSFSLYDEYWDDINHEYSLDENPISYEEYKALYEKIFKTEYIAY